MDTPEIDYPKLAEAFLAGFRAHTEGGVLELIVDRQLFKDFGKPVPLRLYSRHTKSSSRLVNGFVFVPSKFFMLEPSGLHNGRGAAWSKIHDSYDGLLTSEQFTVHPPTLAVFLQNLEDLDIDELPKCSFELAVHIGTMRTAANGVLGDIYPAKFMSSLLATSQEPQGVGFRIWT